MAHAEVRFENGFWVTTGGTLSRTYPTEVGFWAEYDQKGQGLQYVGPFRSRNEAYTSAIGNADFRNVYYVKERGQLNE